MQKEILHGGELLDDNGHLTDTGYAKSLVLNYDRSKIKANKLRIKEWDYYLICDKEYGLALTIADNSYMGMGSVSVLDFTDQSEITKSIMSVLPLGKSKMPSSSKEGNCYFNSKEIDLAFYNNGINRQLKAKMPKFKDNDTLKAEITLTDEPVDSMVIVTPYKEDDKAFYYNQKINCLKVNGYVEIGDFKHEFKDGYAVLDWGRGVWTYENTWYWSSASGEVNGKPFGFNLGYGFGDTSAASENMLFYDGKGHKLEQVTFNIPQKDNKDDFMSEWTFTSSDNRFNAVFTPVLDRNALTDFKVLKSDQHQVFGYFNGTAILDDGTEIILKDFLGFAEKVYNKW